MIVYRLLRHELESPYKPQEVQNEFDYCNLSKEFTADMDTLDKFKNGTLCKAIEPKLDPWRHSDLDYF